MKVVTIIQSRLGSTRLPGKALMLLDSKPMIQHVVERARAIQGVDETILAVPVCDLGEYCSLQLPCIMSGGSRDDVLSRYHLAAWSHKADVIVRITGDCPLLAPNLAERALKEFEKLSDPLGYVACCQPYSNVADGWDVEVFSYELLDQAHILAQTDEQEHVVTWMRKVHRVRGVPTANYCALKCSVDTQADFDRVQRIMDHLDNKADYSHAATWEAWEKAGRP
jgi:spore coat polysaccharide biosynthesis protein SpsF (cytidylyltransferase family)